MRTTLRAKVEVQEVVILAEMAVLERHPELQLLCAMAAKQGTLTPQGILATLPGLSPAASHTLHRHCQYLALCDVEGRLTQAGQRCAETGDVPIPELGIYRLWVARHPCCGELLLHFRRERTDKKDQDFASLQPVPDWLRADKQRSWTSVLDSELRFSLRELPAAPREGVRCRLSQAAACELTWEMDFDSGRNGWALTGTLKWQEAEQLQSARFSTQPAPVPGVDLRETFATWERRWDARRGRVAIAYDGAEQGASGQPFLRNLSYSRVGVPNRGEYSQVEVLDVPVGPSSAAEAQRWVEALLCARLGEERGYIPAERVQERFKQTVQGSPLEEHRVQPPEREALMRQLQAAGRHRAAWLLAAPLDLCPPGAAVMRDTAESSRKQGAA
jgi:hypothetical protein